MGLDRTMPDIEPGDTTEVHGLGAPELYENFDEQFRALLEAVDTGLVIVEESESALEDYEGGNHSGVLGLVADEDEPAFYVSDGGSFGDPITIDVDLEDLDDAEIDLLGEDLSDTFVEKGEGGEVQGDIEMTAGAALDASDGQLILPTDP